MRRFLVLAVAVALAGCVKVAPVDPTAPPPTAAQIAAAKAAVAQANFKQVCKYAGGAWQLAKPIAAVPAVAAKIGPDGALAVKALDIFVTSTCADNLDINDADAIIQKGYDIGGQVIAMIIAAQSK